MLARQAMKVRFLEGAEAGTVQLAISLQPANVPSWIKISPYAPIRKFVTTPSRHYFESPSPEEFGVRKELLDTVRAFLAKEIDEASAIERISDSLTWWSVAAK